MSIEEFKRTSAAAITTSIRTNMRTIYQDWGFLGLIYMLADRYDVKMVYPEIPYLPLERSGRQRARSIPPNLIIECKGKGYLSFFLEAPRPVSWEDTEDLKKYWNLYTTLRPDLLVYSGIQLDILDVNSSPPVKKPNVVIEFKELNDWFVRVREVKGPFAKPLTAEEWRFRWIEGLWDGLSEILGVEREKVVEKVKSERGIRASEPRIVTLYRRVYNPDLMLLISRAKIPSNIRRELEDNDIIVVDNVGFNVKMLNEAIDHLENFISGTKTLTLQVDTETFKLIEKLQNITGKDRGELIKLALRRLLEDLK